MQHSYYLLNWKLYRSYAATREWCTQYGEELAALGQRAHIVLFPEISSLAFVASHLRHPLLMGAQYCSAVPHGSYTGAISAQSLAEIGCSVCIVGHYETRQLFHLTDETITAITQTLLAYKITPVICIGEQSKTPDDQQRERSIAQQLKPLEPILTDSPSPLHLMIAYEPVWAIGASQPPAPDYISGTGAILKAWSLRFPHHRITLLYGGSVQESSIESLRQISFYEGFMLGRASLDMQTLKKLIY